MLALAVYAHNPPRANSCSDSAKSGLTCTGPDYDRQVYLHVAENLGILDINCGERTRLAGQRQQPVALWRCPCTLSGPAASLLLCCFNYFTLTFIKKQEYEQTIFPERDIKKKQRGEAQEVFSDLLEISYEATGLPQCVQKKKFCFSFTWRSVCKVFLCGKREVLKGL